MRPRLFDQDSGNLLPELPIIMLKRRKIKEKNWMILFQDYLAKLAQDETLTGVDYKVMIWLLHMMDYDNWVPVTQVYVAEQLGIVQPQVNRSIGKLLANGHLRWGDFNGRQTLVVNDKLVRKGERKLRG